MTEDLKKGSGASFFVRAKQAARYVISDILPTTWMSPLQPLTPFTPVVSGRQYDYNIGQNLFYTPRGNERYGFPELRNLARNSELVRLAIETRQDQMASQPVGFRPKPGSGAKENDPRIKELEKFFDTPDRVHDFFGWQRIILEELFVTDAVSLYRRRDRMGRPYSIEPIDGATIFPLIDAGGRQPMAPDPAFQQILKGVPKTDYTSDELLYAVRKTQVNNPYGWSVVEQVALAAAQDIERVKSQLLYFTAGALPDAYAVMPDKMTADNVLAFEREFNDLYSGNLAGKRGMPFFPFGSKIENIKDPLLKDEFDEWLARKICYAFSLPPTALVKQVNRATAEQAQSTAADEGLAPLKLWFIRIINRLIVSDFGYEDLEAYYLEAQEDDPAQQATILTTYQEKGTIARNEARLKLGLDPFNDPAYDIPLPLTVNGYVTQEDMQAQRDQQLLIAQSRVAQPGTEGDETPGNQQPQVDGKQPNDKKPDVKKKPEKRVASTYPIGSRSLH